jgi:hypothetical protein
MTDRERPGTTDRELDPGAYIGREPELASETIPGGVQPDDDRVAFNASRRAVDGEPGSGTSADPPERREAGQNR